MSPPCIYKDYNIRKRVTLAYIVITIIGNYYMSFFGYSYFTINIAYIYKNELKESLWLKTIKNLGIPLIDYISKDN